ncbi:type II/IV secretion system protein [Candidatus Parcubacteria bacterium]|nr:type II/IV secretion system protein [Candidatus Parcubacteria bacterium]
MIIEEEQLKEFMVDAGLISPERFEDCKKKAEKEKKPIDEILVQENIISKEDLNKLKGYILGLPFVDLEKETIDFEVLNIIPESVARNYNLVAYKKRGEILEVAIEDPENLSAIELLKKALPYKILPRLTSRAGIQKALQQYKQTLKEIEGFEMPEKLEIKSIEEKDKEKEKKEELEKIAQELPIIKIVDTLIHQAILEGASDVHIEPMEKEVLVRYRIDGILRDKMVLPKITASGIVARIKVLSNLRLDEHRLPQDGRFKVETEDYKYSIRVSILPVFDGEKIVMRLLPETGKPLSLEQLGLWGKALEDVKANIKKPLGMILVCGPTGSGKTTTLYSILSILNTPSVNISTIEDPIEYRMPRINQTQVQPKIGLTFAAGLRALLRQDPDIIMVGEIRDLETASLAVNAALTGHLVLSTLHTNSAAGAIPRLIDMKVEPFLLSATLNCIIAQRLVRKLYKEKQEYFLTRSQIENLSKYCDLNRILEILRNEGLAKPNQPLNKIPFFRPIPSKEAPDGYKGRIGIFEVLPVTKKIKEMIEQKAPADLIESEAKKEGMLTMVEDGFIKAAKGITSIEEVLRVIIE